ncbi:transcriptional regulator [Streptomyces tsukubensis]|uniref:Transcriptional regulator n=1 Tax=Streptomyces tsukubensis TaxID=83656 RepID=A0A1V4A4W5_9ACTN|nr:transcriptional regulator [Streptomyces tsukubensis]
MAVLIVVVLVAGYGAFVYFWAGGRLRTTEAFSGDGRAKAGKGTDWLLIGSDSRSDLTAEQRRKLHVGGGQGLNTDTLMIVHYGDSGPYLVSIPRDSYVEIPGHGHNKINAAYALGGAKLLTRTVEQATGLRLDHYAEVDFLGFVDVVDALGGVRICVPKGGLHDKHSGADFAAGCRQMDGVQALAYVRARYTDPQGDLGRVKRQRQLVSAVADKAFSAPVVLNPWKQIPFLRTSLDALTVDKGTGTGTLVGLGREMKKLSDGDGATTTVPIAAEPQISGVGDVVEWDTSKADDLFGALREDTPIPTSGTN